MRGKFKSLLETPSPAAPHRLKKQSRKMQASVGVFQPPNVVVRSELLTKHRNQRVMEAAAPSTSAVIDLNQISLPVIGRILLLGACMDALHEGLLIGVFFFFFC